MKFSEIVISICWIQVPFSQSLLNPFQSGSMKTPLCVYLHVAKSKWPLLSPSLSATSNTFNQLVSVALLRQFGIFYFPHSQVKCCPPTKQNFQRSHSKPVYSLILSWPFIFILNRLPDPPKGLQQPQVWPYPKSKKQNLGHGVDNCSSLSVYQIFFFPKPFYTDLRINHHNFYLRYFSASSASMIIDNYSIWRPQFIKCLLSAYDVNVRVQVLDGEKY